MGQRRQGAAGSQVQASSARTGQGACLTHAIAQPQLCWALNEPRAHGTQAASCPALHLPALDTGLKKFLGPAGAGSRSCREQKQVPSVMAVLKDAAGKDAVPDGGGDPGSSNGAVCGVELG